MKHRKVRPRRSDSTNRVSGEPGAVQFLLRVLSRGQINTEEECRLLDAYTSDSDCPDLTPDQRALAERLLSAFHAE